MQDHLIAQQEATDADPENWPKGSPAEIVGRAAKLMHQRAESATSGRWCASPVFSPRSHATSAVYSHAHPAGSAESEVVASRLAKPHDGGIRNPHDAEHIAAMDPTTADLVAESWLVAADAMGPMYAHVHAVIEASPDAGWAVYDHTEKYHPEWTATLKAALGYLREGAPEVTAR